MELTQAVAELYATEPDGFLARRKELVVQARAAKDRDAVKAIGALRRPAVAAWLINLLQRDAEGSHALAELAALGVGLREAQFALQATRLRELGRERRTRVADLVSRAVDLAEAAGHTVSPAVEREIDETLVAAVADEAAADAVLSGALTRPLSYSGFGEVDVDAAVALPLRTRAAARVVAGSADSGPVDDGPADSVPDDGPSPQEQRRAAARQAELDEATVALQAAESALAAAEAAASRAADHLDQARADATAAGRVVDDLERVVTSARQTAAAAEAEQQAAEADALVGRRAEQEAQAQVERLRQVIGDLD